MQISVPQSKWILVWDLCVAGLIVFPILTGGVWIHTPTFKAELTELAVPVLLVALFGVIIQYGFKKPLLEGSFFIRVSLSLWKFWENAVARNPRRILWTGSLIVGLLYSWVSLRRHWAFQSSSYDLGIFTNAIWQLVFRGEYISSVKDGMNLFSDHQSPLFWLLGPFYYLFPKPETLLVLQGFGLATGGVALYWIGKSDLFLRAGVRAGVLAALPLMYWAYLPLRNANRFDFHPEVFMLPLFLWAIAWFQTTLVKKGGFDRALGFGVSLFFFILALGAKESAPCVAVGIGLALLVWAGRCTQKVRLRILGCLIIALSALVFYFDTQILPRWLGGGYAYQENYSQFGSGLRDVFLAPFIHPVAFWTQILGIARLKFLFWTLAPLAFLPLLNWRTMIAALPGYLILFMSSGDLRVQMIYHYSIEPSVGLFWALPLGFEKFLNLKGSTRYWSWASVWVVFWVLLAFGRSELYWIRQYTPTEHQEWLLTEFVPSMTSETSSCGSIAATGALVPHLANRPWIQDIPNVKSKRTGRWVDCVVIDTALKQWPLKNHQESQAFLEELPNLNYRKIYECGSLKLYEHLLLQKAPCERIQVKCYRTGG